MPQNAQVKIGQRSAAFWQSSLKHSGPDVARYLCAFSVLDVRLSAILGPLLDFDPCNGFCDCASPIPEKCRSGACQGFLDHIQREGIGYSDLHRALTKSWHAGETFQHALSESLNETGFYICSFNISPITGYDREITFPKISEESRHPPRWKQARSSEISFSNGGNASRNQDSLIKNGFSFGVKARSRRDAYYVSRDRARTILDHIRSVYLLETHLMGPVSIAKWLVEQKTVGEVSWFNLPRPQWTEGPTLKNINVRPPIPGYPILPQNQANQRINNKWRAARSHVSTAISIWSEDAHHAASEIFQAIECLLPDDPTERQIKAFLKLHLGERKMEGRLRLGSRTRPKLSMLAEKMATALIGEIDVRYSWIDNEAQSQLIACENNGAIWYALPLKERVALIVGARHGTSAFDCMRIRTAKLLARLYDIRNSFVHSGERLYPSLDAENLAESGLELISVIGKAVQRGEFPVALTVANIIGRDIELAKFR